MTDEKPKRRRDRWVMLPHIADVSAPIATDIAAGTDLTDYIKACDDAVHDLVYRYQPTPPKPLFEEGVTVGHQVMWSGQPGPGMVRPVAMLVDEDGNVVVEPTGEWQDTTIIDDERA